VRVRRLADGRDLGDRVDWIRYSGVSWTKDGRGFFYTRYPAPPKDAGAGKTLSGASRDPVVYYHRLGTAQAADAAVFRYPKEPTWGVGAQVSEDGRWLFATVGRGTDPENHLYVADLARPVAPNVRAPLVPVDTTMEASFSPVGVVGTTAYVVTNLGAPKYRLVAVDLRAPARANWKTVIPETANTLTGAVLAGGRLLANYLVDVKEEVAIHALDGRKLGMLPLPGPGQVAGLSGRADSPEVFFGFTSYLVPGSVYRHDLRTGATETFFTPDVPFDASRYEAEQVFYASKGRHARADVRGAPEGARPRRLAPDHALRVRRLQRLAAAGVLASVAAWLEMGGVYAVPNLRGGGEYGEAWHQAGKLDRKQNVFDDFIGAAEYLIAQKYTSPAKLAIRGGSNGGLLVGAAMTQRPELFGVALPAVGVMDMLRYDKFSAGVFWVPEYGSASDPKLFPTLAKYSPLHNLKAGTCYPATLTTTADHDDRVVPSHSFKWASALQAAQGCDRPALIRVETQGSHGYRPLDKQIAEQADVLGFTARNLGMPVQFPPPPPRPRAAME
jgi:prolyl oligopeptidase